MKIKIISLNIVLSLALFCISFYAAWQLSASSNFFYSFWYELLGISETIESYGPKNKYKLGFEQTQKTEQVKLFSGIVHAIQRNGEGLNQLSYKNKEKNVTLLTNAEIIHLQDVANLVATFKTVAIFSLVLIVIVLTFMRITKTPIAKIKKQLLGGIVFIVLLILLLLIIGPKEVFYLGHELIFPNNHQWFFYYEESLMSTMMKAPALFGPIACQLLVLTFLIWIGLLFLLKNAVFKDK